MQSNIKMSHVLVQGTADWNQPIATNQHYVVRELAKQYDVSFVESLGLRRPELKVKDIRRIIQRLLPNRQNRRSYRSVPSNVKIISPKLIPVHTFPLNILNRRLLNRKISHEVNPHNRFYWTFSPITYGVESTAQTTIYHCVDLYGEYPGINRTLIHESERSLAAKDVIAIGSSQVVVDHLKSQGFRHVLYWKNVADTELFLDRTRKSNYFVRTGALFAGNLSDKKIDFPLLNSIVRGGIELHLAGPIAEGGGHSRQLVNDLVKAGAQYHGILSLEDLSHLMSKCRVGLIPYQINSYTEGVSPLKTYEYMAAGLSVVSTELPGVEKVNRHVFVTNSPAEFVATTREELLNDNQKLLDDRLALAEEHSWIQRGQECRSLVSDSAVRFFNEH